MKVFISLGIVFLAASGFADPKPGELQPLRPPPQFTPTPQMLPPVNVKMKDRVTPTFIQSNLRVGSILEIANTGAQMRIYAKVMKIENTRLGVDVFMATSDRMAVSGFISNLKIGDSVKIFDEKGNMLLDSPIIEMRQAAEKVENSSLTAGKYSFRFVEQRQGRAGE